jgi:hypothetical protein
MFCFHMPALLYGKDLYLDTYLWPPFREAEFCCVQSYIWDKLGCAAGEKRLRTTEMDNDQPLTSPCFLSIHDHLPYPLDVTVWPLEFEQCR